MNMFGFPNQTIKHPQGQVKLELVTHIKVEVWHGFGLL